MPSSSRSGSPALSKACLALLLAGISPPHPKTHIDEGGVDVVGVRDPFHRSQVNPGMIIWREIKTLH